MKSRWKLSEKDIKQITNLYVKGYTKCAIARKFHVDHSTIFYHIEKQATMNVGIIGATKRNRKTEQRYRIIDGERINLGMRYDQYLSLERMRTKKLQESCTHSKPNNCRCSKCGKQLVFPVRILGVHNLPIRSDIIEGVEL